MAVWPEADFVIGDEGGIAAGTRRDLENNRIITEGIQSEIIAKYEYESYSGSFK